MFGLRSFECSPLSSRIGDARVETGAKYGAAEPLGFFTNRYRTRQGLFDAADGSAVALDGRQAGKRIWRVAHIRPIKVGAPHLAFEQETGFGRWMILNKLQEVA